MFRKRRGADARKKGLRGESHFWGNGGAQKTDIKVSHRRCQYVRKLGPSGLAHFSAYKIGEETLTLSLSISGLGNDMHAPFFAACFLRPSSR